MSKAWMVLLGLLLVVIPAFAAHRAMVYGLGARSCGSFTATAKGSLSYDGYADWAEGAMTALNETQPGVGNILGDTDIDGAMAWLTNYCQAHPLATFNLAVGELLNRLSRNAQNSDVRK